MFSFRKASPMPTPEQYLVKNPRGYCGLGGTGIAFPGGEAGVK